MRTCDHCGGRQGEGRDIDETWLCNGCLSVLLVEAQIDADREEEYNVPRTKNGNPVEDCY